MFIFVNLMQESQAGWEGGGPLDIRKSLVVVGMVNEIIDLYRYFIERILNIIRAKNKILK
jgi:hypothetical protein